MARYKDSDLHQSKMIPINLAEQITPGSFEHTISLLVDEHIDMSIFDARYDNDEHGRPAYDPAMLLRVILSAYARGFTSSRQIERLCRENVVFMALSGDSQPHLTTIANFIRQMDDVIQPIFTQVLMVCSSQGLIGGEMFAIDGCKLPSNASRSWSGTHAQLEKKHKKIDRAVRRMLKKHRDEDATGQVNDHTRRAAEANNIEKLREASRKIKKFCKTTTERRGLSGKIVQSNITDNESAKMHTSHGVIQGYNGVAAVDAKHQIVVAAEAFGQGPENNLLRPMVEQVASRLGSHFVQSSKITADAGFHRKKALDFCEDKSLDAYLADGNFRKRDPRFIEKSKHHPKARQAKYFASSAFTYDVENQTCRCPAGFAMYRASEHRVKGIDYITFAGRLTDCRSCSMQSQCMRKPPTERGRQVSFQRRTISNQQTAMETMKRKIDTEEGRHIYGQRLGTVEPVFGNINTTKRLNRFTLRGKSRVNAQWLMYCMVQNVEKLQRYAALA